MNKKLRYLTTVAMLSALAMIIMLFDFPLPFLPSFYKIDFSDSIILIGGYILGPAATIIMEVLKNALKLLFKPTSTAFVGELANILTGIALVWPACYIYKKMASTKGMLLGLGAGLVSMTVLGCAINAYILLPFYATLYNMPLTLLIAMGTALNSSITDLFTFVALAVAPFNLIKGGLDSLIVTLIQPRLKSFIRSHQPANGTVAD